MTCTKNSGAIAESYEILVRQECANLIQVVGMELQFHQLRINAAIVYLHRFFAADPINAMIDFSSYEVAIAAFFIAAKIDSRKTKLKGILGEYFLYFGGKIGGFDGDCAAVKEQMRNVVRIERIVLSALKFDLTVEQPHTHITDFLVPVEADSRLRDSACALATINLHLTVMCVKYTPKQIACVSIYLASKIENCAIPGSYGRGNWFHSVDDALTIAALDKMSAEFTSVSQNQIDDFDSSLCKACYKNSVMKPVWTKLMKVISSGRRKRNGKRKAGRDFDLYELLHAPKSARKN